MLAEPEADAFNKFNLLSNFKSSCAFLLHHVNDYLSSPSATIQYILYSMFKSVFFIPSVRLLLPPGCWCFYFYSPYKWL